MTFDQAYKLLSDLKGSLPGGSPAIRMADELERELYNLDSSRFTGYGGGLRDVLQSSNPKNLPKYKRIAYDILKGIHDGTYKKDHPLPDYNTLMKMYGIVSDTPIIAALNMLHDDHIVIRRSGNPSIVNPSYNPPEWAVAATASRDGGFRVAEPEFRGLSPYLMRVAGHFPDRRLSGKEMVIRYILTGIEEGVFKPNEYIPPAGAIGDKFDIGEGTVRIALRALFDEAVLLHVRGQHPIVNPDYEFRPTDAPSQ